MGSIQLIRKLDCADLEDPVPTGIAFTVEGKYEELDRRLKQFNKKSLFELFAHIDKERKEIFSEYLLVPKTDVYRSRFVPVYKKYVERLDVILGYLTTNPAPNPQTIKDLLVFTQVSDSLEENEWNAVGFAFTEKGLRNDLDAKLRSFNLSPKKLLWNQLVIEREDVWRRHVQIESTSFLTRRFNPIYREYLAKLDTLIEYFGVKNATTMTDEEVQLKLVF